MGRIIIDIRKYTSTHLIHFLKWRRTKPTKDLSLAQKSLAWGYGDEVMGTRTFPTSFFFRFPQNDGILDIACVHDRSPCYSMLKSE